jgi:hypothetical protein
VIKKELLRAATMVREGRPWAEFIHPPELLSDCVNAVDVVFKTERGEEFKQWQDFAKSRISLMVTGLTVNVIDGISVVPLPFIFRARRPNTGHLFLGLLARVPKRMKLTKILDKEKNRLFFKSEPNGNSITSQILSIDEFRRMMASEFYALQLPWAVPNQLPLTTRGGHI